MILKKLIPYFIMATGISTAALLATSGCRGSASISGGTYNAEGRFIRHQVECFDENGNPTQCIQIADFPEEGMRIGPDGIYLPPNFMQPGDEFRFKYESIGPVRRFEWELSPQVLDPFGTDELEPRSSFDMPSGVFSFIPVNLNPGFDAILDNFGLNSMQLIMSSMGLGNAAIVFNWEQIAEAEMRLITNQSPILLRATLNPPPLNGTPSTGNPELRSTLWVNTDVLGQQLRDDLHTILADHYPDMSITDIEREVDIAYAFLVSALEMVDTGYTWALLDGFAGSPFIP